MSDYHIRTTCRLCASPQLETLLTLPDTPLANEYQKQPECAYDAVPRCQDRFPLYLVGCLDCGHVQLPVVVDPKRLFPPSYPYQSGTSAVFREHLEGIADWVREHHRYQRVLEIASNDGTLLCMMAKRGNPCVGVDPCGEIKSIGVFVEHDC